MGERRRSRVVRLVCKSADEAEQITRALEDPQVRAFVTIVGVLLPFGDRARTRILEFVNDRANEDAGRIRIESTGDRHDVDAAVMPRKVG